MASQPVPSCAPAAAATPAAAAAAVPAAESAPEGPSPQRLRAAPRLTLPEAPPLALGLQARSCSREAKIQPSRRCSSGSISPEKESDAGPFAAVPIRISAELAAVEVRWRRLHEQQSVLRVKQLDALRLCVLVPDAAA